MQNLTFVGIDISKATLDICLISPENNRQSLVISNDVKTITRFLGKFKHELIIGMENTGRYNWSLYEALEQTPHRVFVISPLHLKKSMGLIRGKNDKIDAARIASFILKNYQELQPWKPAPAAVQQLKILLTERTSRIKAQSTLLKQQHDYAGMKNLGLDKSLMALSKQQLSLLKKQLQVIEKQIEALIKADEHMQQQAALIRSVPGVGKVLCWMMLAKTESFTILTEPRKMACYSGVVPFSYQSGTSVRGRDRVSAYADKALKTTLHLAAMSAIRLENDLMLYYRRKVDEGKNKMSALNAVRNKIIHRIFAVIKHQKTYQNHLLLS